MVLLRRLREKRLKTYEGRDIFTAASKIPNVVHLLKLTNSSTYCHFPTGRTNESESNLQQINELNRADLREDVKNSL